MKGIEHTRQGGMSLIEVLVALLVLGIGVMGYAALQLNAVRMTEDTYSRTQAMAIAKDLSERVITNVDAASDYLDESAWTGTLTPATCFSTTPSATTKPCSPADMAVADIYQTRLAAQTMLPNGTLAVGTCPEAGAKINCVTVAWGETTTAGCDEKDVDNGQRGVNANCVTLSL